MINAIRLLYFNILLDSGYDVFADCFEDTDGDMVFEFGTVDRLGWGGIEEFNNVKASIIEKCLEVLNE
jgi:hypothetical protein